MATTSKFDHLELIALNCLLAAYTYNDDKMLLQKGNADIYLVDTKLYLVPN